MWMNINLADRPPPPKKPYRGIPTETLFPEWSLPSGPGLAPERKSTPEATLGSATPITSTHRLTSETVRSPIYRGASQGSTAFPEIYMTSCTSLKSHLLAAPRNTHFKPILKPTLKLLKSEPMERIADKERVNELEKNEDRKIDKKEQKEETEETAKDTTAAETERQDNDEQVSNSPFDAMDWKDGIASLPGSNLKFKLTEFGTLEMVSTVETDKGEHEWSTATEHHVSLGDKDGAALKSKTEEPPHKTEREDTKTHGHPGNGNILCCEVCGKYGLPHDFSASGRFCSLYCVGAHTGRRNKGREFKRQSTTPTVNGKIIRKKKKRGRKPVGFKKAVKQRAGIVSGHMIMENPGRGRLLEMGSTYALEEDEVRYDVRKAFSWPKYLTENNAKAAPANVFRQENPHLEMFPQLNHGFKKGMKLEAIDPKHPSYICVCTIVRVKGCRLRLHFDGWSESYDFWTNVDSPFIFPVGWCEKNGQTLHPPRSMSFLDFNWERYLKKHNGKPASECLFKQIPASKHGFRVGMKLEAVDRKNPDLICVATVTNVIGNHFLVHFDEWEDTYDYWCEDSCPYIHPVGWCAENGKRLNPPNDDDFDTFIWDEYLNTTETVAAPPDIFKKRPPTLFERHQKLEAVDKRNPTLVRAATVADVLDYHVRLHFDGWEDIYDDWFDADSTDLHPVEWCKKTGHPLEPPLTKERKYSSAACPTPGCEGIGHVKGAKYSTHHSRFGCPYSLQNLNKPSCLVDRLSANSMTEESDWSYGRKFKPVDGKKSRPRRTEALLHSDMAPDFLNQPPSTNISLDIHSHYQTVQSCPTPGCDGSGHVKKPWKTHYTLSGCPRNRNNFNRQAFGSTNILGKRDRNQRALYLKPEEGEESSLITSSSFRQIISKEEKSTDSTAKQFAEKGVQHVSTSCFQWSLSKHNNQLVNFEDELVSDERQRISKWSVDDVVCHVKSLGCVEQAKFFATQQIDGEAFLLLNQSDIVNILKIKLGPALKILNTIPK